MTLSDEQIQELLRVGNPTDEECQLIRMGWDAALARMRTTAVPDGWKLVHIVSTGGQAMTALDSTHTTAVDHGYHWQPMTSCPKGSKVQLLTRYGCAIYGQWNGRDTIYTGWAPLPTRAAKGEAGADYINQKDA